MRAWLLFFILPLAALRGAQPQPSFEVAAIHRASPDEKNIGYRFLPGGRFEGKGVRLLDLLLLSWHVQPFQIPPLPGWMETERFDVEAKAAGTPGEDDMRTMVRSLVEQRFHGSAHIEIRDSPLYTIGLARGGIRAGGLIPTGENECVEQQLTGTYNFLDGSSLPVCGVREKLVPGSDGAVLMRMYGAGVTMEMLARVLRLEVDRYVENTVKLDGRFTFSLDFTPSRAIDTPGTRFDPSGASLFTALEEKLGVQLRSGRGPVEMLLVEHAERPSEN